jgi:hypothetical protein
MDAGRQITEGTEDTEITEKNAKNCLATDGAQMHTDEMRALDLKSDI